MLLFDANLCPVINFCVLVLLFDANLCPVINFCVLVLLFDANLCPVINFCVGVLQGTNISEIDLAMGTIQLTVCNGSLSACFWVVMLHSACNC